MKIAFLFLTIGDLNHEFLWKEYFKGNEDKYNIYCHPKDKNNVKSEWLKNYIIDKNVETSWGRTINSILELLRLFNYLKIGIIYGLIVDAFKLGS